MRTVLLRGTLAIIAAPGPAAARRTFEAAPDCLLASVLVSTAEQ